MTIDHGAVAAELPAQVTPSGLARELSEWLDARRREKSRADVAASERLAERLRTLPSPSDLRGDLEDALVEVAAHAVQAMVRLREQRQAGVVEPDAIADCLGRIADGLRMAELTSAAIRVPGPVPR